MYRRQYNLFNDYYSTMRNVLHKCDREQRKILFYEPKLKFCIRIKHKKSEKLILRFNQST